MYFRGLVLILLLIPRAISAEVEKPPELVLQPNNCVALHKGRTCYANVKFVWHSSYRGHFCLFNQTTQKQVYCWVDELQGVGQFEFAAAQAQQYQIIDMSNKSVVAEQQMSLSWLYNASNKRRRWRLF